MVQGQGYYDLEAKTASEDTDLSEPGLLTHRIEDDRAEEVLRTGWLRSYPDLRDYTESDVEDQLKKMKIPLGTDPEPLPDYVDLGKWITTVKTQGNLGSCTAHAATSMVEYYQERAHGKSILGSRRFVYKNTRWLIGAKGDSGAYLRSTMASLVLFGVPPERYWSYVITAYDKWPPVVIYSLADNWEALTYFCHDPVSLDRSGADVLYSVRKHLAAGLPSMFGFYVFENYKEGGGGKIPYPNTKDRCIGGHAVLAIGYDDTLVIKDRKTQKTTKGAIKFLNSWGKAWGDGGYGWLPYAYTKEKLALDYWSLTSMEWVDTGQFGL